MYMQLRDQSIRETLRESMAAGLEPSCIALTQSIPIQSIMEYISM